MVVLKRVAFFTLIPKSGRWYLLHVPHPTPAWKKKKKKRSKLDHQPPLSRTRAPKRVFQRINRPFETHYRFHGHRYQLSFYPSTETRCSLPTNTRVRVQSPPFFSLSFFFLLSRKRSFNSIGPNRSENRERERKKRKEKEEELGKMR